MPPHTPALETQRISLHLLAGTVLSGAALGALLGLMNYWGILLETWTGPQPSDAAAIAFGALANGAMLGAAAGLIPGVGALSGMALQKRRQKSGRGASQRGAALTGAATATLLVSCAGLAVLLPSAPAGFWIGNAAGYLVLSLAIVWTITTRFHGRGSRSAN